MRRLSCLCCSLLLVLAGCPGEGPTPLPPTSQPAEQPPPATVETSAVAAPDSQAAPPEPDIMEQLAAMGPRMTFDLRPMSKATAGDVEVVLERIAMLRRDEEHLANEPWDAKGDAAEQGHYMALLFSIKIGGVAWTELPPGEQVGMVGPLVIEFEGEPVLMESGTFEPLEGRPESAYHYRRFVPPAHKDGKMVVALGIEQEGKEPLSVKFPPLHPLRKGASQPPPEAPPADEKPADEKPADAPTDQKPADEKPADEKPADEKPADEKPADEKPAEPGETGDEEH